MEIIKQLKFCWYLDYYIINIIADFFIIFGLLIVKIYVSFLF